MMHIYRIAVLPLKFKANGIACGLKKSGKLDLALILSELPAAAACKFTINSLKAAPVLVSLEYLKRIKKFRAIVANSGNANCFNGAQGIEDARLISRIAARELGVKKEEVLLASTGIIGKRLALDKVGKNIPLLVKGLSRAGIAKAKRAMLTTDTFTKEITAKFKIGGKTATICGIAKGAGMIAPHMATMLVFIMTDAMISAGSLKKALDAAVEKTFNCITVDGCMSTNDSVIVLANGACANKLIKNGADFALFTKALKNVCQELAKMIIMDAEGASKFIVIKVKNAANFKEAKKVGLSIANSGLFKTAMFAENPNFGRIAAAVGSSGVKVEEKNLKFKVSDLKKKQIGVEVSLGKGDAEAVIYTSDLTPEYIKINADYN